ncbi:S9 family peptidase [Lysobacter solisilvae]|uniref:S9 family peptidase n=1 Tax=Agrilutibacter solisilvae TaxID=2763317 RepID=A0A974Y2L7_9GAMM|nr:S9 family peptidase [Lysobacter solisilvae]QSX80128.1 S9 family peptidase [Lysobacter solisilvae]
MAALLATAPALAAPAPVDVNAFIRKDIFNDIQISPDGQFFAATVPREDRTILVILRRSDNQVTATVDDGRHSHVAGFTWASASRLLVTMARKFGSLDSPGGTGEIYGVDVDGQHAGVLVGGSAKSQNARKSQSVIAQLVDDLPHDDQYVIIGAHPYEGQAYTLAERMDVRTGRRTTVARSPVVNADFTTDTQGVVRFAAGADSSRRVKLYYRAGPDAEWTLVNDESQTGLDMSPIGFSPDNKTAYLEAEQASGPNAILAFDTVSGERRQVMRDDQSDPAGAIRDANGAVVGFSFYDGARRTAFLDETSSEAQLYRTLEKTFGQAVHVTSRTADGRKLLLQVWSDRDPGDFYIFDTTAKTAEHVAARGSWLDAKNMAAMEPVRLKARDGMELYGYLTLPAGSSGKNLPMIVNPHGGPFGIQDLWGFQSEVQMLAQAGYAVLQLNYRGSGGYGDAYNKAGARQWGLSMQDDLTDATRWAIAQGVADPSRICIYGASYGAYAALMGVAKEPELYRCAAGYVGVYDLPAMYDKGDIQERKSGISFLDEWLGKTELAASSPNRLADRIKAPVFLAAGGEDRRAPIEHSRMMEAALKKADKPVEALYYETEGHGFYTQEHQREYYTRLLAFFARHLGGAPAASAAAPSSAK